MASRYLTGTDLLGFDASSLGPLLKAFGGGGDDAAKKAEEARKLADEQAKVEAAAHKKRVTYAVVGTVSVVVLGVLLARKRK